MKNEQYELLKKRLSHIGFSPPRTYEKIGNILIISLDDKWSMQEEEIGKAYMEVFGAQSVLKKGRISGEFRLPSHKKIAGASTETIHRENGILYRLNATSIMFSFGNIKERMRVAGLPKDEHVIDMFAGLGYFSLPIARFCHSRIVAIEKNPESFRYLCENVKLNRLGHLVEPKNMDCTDYVGRADRVVMGYFGAEKFLPRAFSFLEKGYIMYHDAVPERDLERPKRQLETEATREKRRIEIKELRKIKKFSPGVWHVCVEALVYP